MEVISLLQGRGWPRRTLPTGGSRAIAPFHCQDEKKIPGFRPKVSTGAWSGCPVSAVFMLEPPLVLKTEIASKVQNWEGGEALL